MAALFQWFLLSQKQLGIMVLRTYTLKVVAATEKLSPRSPSKAAHIKLTQLDLLKDVKLLWCLCAPCAVILFFVFFFQKPLLLKLLLEKSLIVNIVHGLFFPLKHLFLQWSFIP